MRQQHTLIPLVEQQVRLNCGTVISHASCICCHALLSRFHATSPTGTVCRGLGHRFGRSPQRRQSAPWEFYLAVARSRCRRGLCCLLRAAVCANRPIQTNRCRRRSCSGRGSSSL
jgi:hypothetical protein